MTRKITVAVVLALALTLYGCAGIRFAADVAICAAHPRDCN